MLRPRKLDLFIARQFMLLFVGAFFICQFVLMMQFLWKYIEDLIGKGLTIDVMAQFFWYMGLMLVPQALPLAILLASLITYGNLGESSELTAIKAAGISLMQSFRPVIVLSIIIALGSFYFQNNIGPEANNKLSQLLLSMRQKSPELEIPEGIFYDGIPNSNLYVQHKDMDTGMLYGIMIYRMTGSYEDQAIILADSGMLQSTADKKHLLLTLHSGEWFENMKSQEVAGSASVPYRRESFTTKSIYLDYDGDFNMTDGSVLSNNVKGKSVAQIAHDVDSFSVMYDSVGHAYHNELRKAYMSMSSVVKKHPAITSKHNPDSLFASLTKEQQRSAVSIMSSNIRNINSELEFRGIAITDGDKHIRRLKVEAIGKFTLALTCIIFFFIGGPLGAIIRKGGLGMPVIISVGVFIFYYILQNSGTRMAIGGMWGMWFGSLLATMVLIPLACFVTYKANHDSVVFNKDAYIETMRRLLGLRTKRIIAGKEVIIEDPDYSADAMHLQQISDDIALYMHKHKLFTAPNIIKVFFHYEPDNAIEDISERLEAIINDLSNTRDKHILAHINAFPIMAVKAHTRPFESKKANITAAIILPLGIFLYLRMWRFRLRLFRDLNTTKQTAQNIINRIQSFDIKA